MPVTSRLGHYRRSCDRCHDQKLRCKRDENSESCQRCQRAKAKCTFSARARPLDPFVFPHRTSGATRNSAPARGAGAPASFADPDSHALDSRDLMSSEFDTCRFAAPLTDIPTVSWDQGLLMFPLGLSTEAGLAQAGAEWDAVVNSPLPTGSSSERRWAPSAATVRQSAFSPPTTSQTAQGIPESDMSMSGASELHKANAPRQSGSDAHAALRRPPIMQGHLSSINRAIRKLSDLSVDLHDFASTIPSVEACWEPSGEYRPLEGKEFALDRILELSQRFIETLNQLFLPSSPPTPGSAQLAGTKTPSALDQPCELLALSNYTRIVETYHAILEHVDACASRQRAILESRLPFSLADSFPRLPSLAVGNFTMNSSSATQVLVLVHMIEGMMSRSRYLVQCMVRVYAPSSPGRGTGGDAGGWGDAEQGPGPTVGQAALEGFRSREGATLQLLGSVRRTLLELGYVQ